MKQNKNRIWPVSPRIPAGKALLTLGKAAALGVAIATLAACSPQSSRVSRASCAEDRIELASNLYNQARQQLTRHFRERVDTALGRAYQSSKDSVQVARASRSCEDFDRVIRRQALDLIRANLLFQRLVISNMRDQDPSVVIDLYGDGYREIFKSDIQ